MAERYEFYVHDNRKITFNLTEPIMREDSGVTDFVFYIPKVLNGLEVSDWSWWLVFVNAKKEKYSIALTLSEDSERPLEYNLATYTVDYAMSIKAGSVQFALEAINAGTGGAIDNEWHTQSYEIKVKDTLQGNQAEYAETESDIISALITEYRNLHVGTNQITDGAVTFAKLANDAVTSVKIADGAVTNGKLASNSVSTANMQDGAITEAKVANSAVTMAKLAGGSVTEAKLADSLKLKTIKDYVTPEMFGANGDGVTDDTQSINSMFSSGNTRFVLNGVYLVSSGINLSGATGIEIIGSGTLKAKSGITIYRLLDLSDSKNVRVGINIDMSQDASVTPNSEKCERGIYAKDAVNLTLDSVEYYHCCVGRPFFIDGTSSNDIDVSANGSKQIYIIDNKIYGTEYNVADEGCYPVIRADFFSNDDSAYISASNGIKSDNLTVDPDVTYPATTQHVYIRGLYAENCDRVALLNVSDCEITDFNLVNCYTRGFNLSPTCKNITIKNGTISGGDACPLATGQACENVVFDSINITPLRPVGQKTSMKATTGCKNIAFKNISGQGSYTSVLLVLSSDNILCENVVLEFNGNTTPMIFDIEDEDVTTPYPITNVTIRNCKIYGNAVMHLVNRGGVALDAIRLINSELHAVNGSFWQGRNTLVSGELHLEDIKVICFSNSALVVDTKNIAYFKNVLGLRITPIEQLTVSAAATIHTFTGLYFRVPDNTIYKAGDTYRYPDVMLFCDGIPLFYNIDWFVGSAQISNFMANSIRLNSSSTVPVNSKLTLVRNS